MISVCMATYNGEKYIRKQLKSILCQLSKNDEIIISDDCSSDKTLDIIKEINDSRIKVYIHDENHGFVPNFENALKYAKGDYIFLSDQDDEWLPDKVSISLQYLKKCDFIVSDCITIDENNNVIDESRFKKYKIKKGFWRLMVKTRYLGCCMAFNKKILKTVLPFPQKYYYMEHDLWIASVAEKYYKVELINKPLIYYRRHGNNVSDGGNGKGYSLLNKINRRIYRLQQLYKIKNKIQY